MEGGGGGLDEPVQARWEEGGLDGGGVTGAGQRGPSARVHSAWGGAGQWAGDPP